MNRNPRPPGPVRRRVRAVAAGSLALLLLAAAPLRVPGSDWPQWRGPARDGHVVGEQSPGSIPEGLAPVWKRPVGTGFASPVVSRGVLVYLDEQAGMETAHAVSLATREELWSVPFAEAFGDEWGSGPRSTPVVDGDRVFVQSCKGEFRCLSMKEGRTLWRTHFEKDYGVEFVGTKVLEGAAKRRGHNGSAIVDGGHVIVPVGSQSLATLVCFDKQTGGVVWKSMHDETAYSSPVIATLAGVRQLVMFTADALAGVDLTEGRLLWRIPVVTDAKRHAVSPVIVGTDRVVAASHSHGMLCVRVEAAAGGALNASVLWRNPDLKVNLSTPTLVGDSLYGFGSGKDYVCVDPSTGKLRWSQAGYGRGVKTDHCSTLAIGERLLVLSESGQLSLLAANPGAHQLLGQAQVCGKTWSTPAYADGRLYLRDGRDLYCYELVAGPRAGGAGPPRSGPTS
ncbi:MAG TPA: hypothetical protein DCM86_13980 [Verrucomicrobiales bacterium]|nr:hypothetical protein [Verrucomicrobiales bacterium]